MLPIWRPNKRGKNWTNAQKIQCIDPNYYYIEISPNVEKDIASEGARVRRVELIERNVSMRWY